jgi:hypothetical protein
MRGEFDINPTEASWIEIYFGMYNWYAWEQVMDLWNFVFIVDVRGVSRVQRARGK